MITSVVGAGIGRWTHLDSDLGTRASGHGLTVLRDGERCTFAVPDRTVSVAAGATAYIPEGPEALQVDGFVYCDWSAGASVTAGLIEDTTR
ncbi:hypothetical protein [Streptomyces sp. NPDC055105]|uniref:hypothetical protein n=1 Tax=Streptomyces sp. NPDC055105 TaxID=3365719 RepID=UPI0037D2B14B